MAESTSERQKADKNIGDSDRLSGLPDSVLCHIMSFLPTKTCMATSILSRRWRHLWEHLQVLDFHKDQDLFDDDREPFRRFADFVNAVLALRRSRDIRKMRLKCWPQDEDMFCANSVATWVRAAVGPCLEELSLILPCHRGSRYVSESLVVLVPSILFTCTTLVSLRLCGLIRVNVGHSSAVSLPSLKKLQFETKYVDSVDAFLSGCPVLETLDLSFSPNFLTKVCVPPSLKRLKFAAAQTYLEIDAPSLKYLHITETTLGAVGNLQNVVEAYLDVLSVGESVDPLLNLLRAISRTKHLELRRSTSEWLLSAPVLDFPEFRYLLHLEIILPCFNYDLLVNMLHKCHVLQVVTIQSKKPSLSQSLEQKPTSVPNCLISHLTSIHFEGFLGSEDELAFAEYLLQNGLVLKTMIIANIPLDLSWKYSVLKRLSDIPRGSAMCRFSKDYLTYHGVLPCADLNLTELYLLKNRGNLLKYCHISTL